MTTAHRVTDDAEFAPGAADRDARRSLPREELDRLSDSGLLGITVPAEFGGAGAALADGLEFVRTKSRPVRRG